MSNSTPITTLLVSTSYPATASDWQGRFIADMVTSLARITDHHLQVWAPPGDMPKNVFYAATDEDAVWLNQLTQAGGIAHLLRKRSLFAIIQAIRLLMRLRSAYHNNAADVLHINWLQNALPLKATGKPALVTVLGSDFGLLKMPGMVFMLRRALQGRRVILAPNAEWMAPKLERHFGNVAEIRPIPFGVDSAWFDIKRTASLAPPHRWLAVTRITRDKIGNLFAWGEGLFGSGRELHLFGPLQEKLTLPGWVVWHGPTNPQKLAHDWFPIAAGLVTLSQHDEGRPQVMLEAMASGLPVIASNLLAHRDFIRHGETGWIADSPKTFASGLECLEMPTTNRMMGEAARKWICTTVGDWDACAARYATAYRELLGHGHG